MHTGCLSAAPQRFVIGSNSFRSLTCFEVPLHPHSTSMPPPIAQTRRLVSCSAGLQPGILTPSAATAALRAPHLQTPGRHERQRHQRQLARPFHPADLPLRGKFFGDSALLWIVLATRCAAGGLSCPTQSCGRNLQQRRLTVESAFTAETSSRSAPPLPRESKILRGRVGPAPSSPAAGTTHHAPGNSPQAGRRIPQPAAVLSSSPVHFLLQLRRQMHFHNHLA
jgi:hypothetical protein